MLNNMERKYIEMGNPVNALQKLWDRNTENGRYPDRMTLVQAKAVINDYMLECGFDSSQLRK